MPLTLTDLAARLCGALLGTGTVFAFLAAGRCLMTLFFPRVARTRRYLGEALVALWLAGTIGIALLALGVLVRPVILAVACLLLALAVSGLGGVAAFRRSLRGDSRFFARIVQAHRRRPASLALALGFALLSLPVLVRPLLSPPLGWDTLTYHGVKSALWAQTGRWTDLSGPGLWSAMAGRPAAQSLLGAIGLTVVGDDLGLTAPEAGYWLLLGLAFLAAARALSVKEPWGSAGALFTLAIPTTRVVVGSGYSEPLLLTLLLGVVVFARDLPRHPRSLCLAGGFLGLAAAVKPHVLIAAPLVMLVLAGATLWRQRSGGRLVWSLSWIPLAGLLLASPVAPWLIHTWQERGHPLSPLPVRLGPFVLGVPDSETVWYNERPGVAAEFDFRQEIEVLARVFASPLRGDETPTILALIPVVVAAFLLRRLVRARWPFPVVVATALACLGWWFHPSFAVVRHTPVMWPTASRFLVPLIVMALLATLPVRREARARAWLVYLYGTSGFFLATRAFRGFARTEKEAFLGLVVFAAGSAALLSLAPLGRVGRARGVAAALVLGLGVIVATRASLRWDIAAEGLQVCPVPKYWVEGARRLDSARPRVIAVTSGPLQNLDRWFTYLFFGSRAQNRVLYVPTSRDGSILHWSAGSLDVERRLADPERWLERLRNQQVDFVMSFEPPSLELSWLEGNPRDFQRLSGVTGRWGLYRVLAPGPYAHR